MSRFPLSTLDGQVIFYDDEDLACIGMHRSRDWLDDLFAELRATPVPAPVPTARRQRKTPTLASITKQASKAGIEVARYEIKPDGTVVVIPGTPSADTASPVTDLDQWLRQKNARPT